MRILVLCHTGWMQRMIGEWRKFKDIEVAELPLPVLDWSQSPELKDRIARLIVDYASVWKPALVLDINGSGLLPVPGEGRYTAEIAPSTWVEWWLEDPFRYAAAHEADESLPLWLKALGCPNVRNYIWDAALAREYSEWTGKIWVHLPGAVSPEAFDRDPIKPPQGNVDVSFLGSFHDESLDDGDASMDGEELAVARRRMANPDDNYFDIVRGGKDEIPMVSAVFERAKRRLWGSFSKEILSIKRSVASKLGTELRNKPLKEIAGKFPSRFFAGGGAWPEGMLSSSDSIYDPKMISGIYKSSTLCLDLAGGSSFSGTSMRAYQIMASGGVMAVNRRPEFDTDGSLEGKVYFKLSGADELKELCARLSSDKALAEKIALDAKDLVSSNHSWINRLPVIAGSYQL